MSHEHDEPTDEPQVLVGISFDDVFRAQEFLTEATRLAAQGRLKLRDAVTIIKNEQGRTWCTRPSTRRRGAPRSRARSGQGCSA